MITAEQTLAEEGEEDLVRGVRRVLQGKFREDASEIVEQLTGRKVKAFLSDHDIEADVAIEAFVLEPVERPRPGSRNAFSPSPPVGYFLRRRR